MNTSRSEENDYGVQSMTSSFWQDEGHRAAGRQTDREAVGPESEDPGMTSSDSVAEHAEQEDNHLSVSSIVSQEALASPSGPDARTHTRSQTTSSIDPEWHASDFETESVGSSMADSLDQLHGDTRAHGASDAMARRARMRLGTGGDPDSQNGSIDSGMTSPASWDVSPHASSAEISDLEVDGAKNGYRPRTGRHGTIVGPPGSLGHDSEEGAKDMMASNSDLVMPVLKTPSDIEMVRNLVSSSRREGKRKAQDPSVQVAEPGAFIRSRASHSDAALRRQRADQTDNDRSTADAPQKRCGLAKRDRGQVIPLVASRVVCYLRWTGELAASCWTLFVDGTSAVLTSCTVGIREGTGRFAGMAQSATENEESLSRKLYRLGTGDYRPLGEPNGWPGSSTFRSYLFASCVAGLIVGYSIGRYQSGLIAPVLPPTPTAAGLCLDPDHDFWVRAMRTFIDLPILAYEDLLNVGQSGFESLDGWVKAAKEGWPGMDWIRW